MTISTIARAALVALALGAGAVATALPVQAQGLSFSFGFGNDNDRFDDTFPRLCLTDFQLRRAIGDQGYRNVALNVENNNRIKARATRGDWVYQLVVNACSGRILDRERLRRA
jgi:hypothetical protein